MKDYLKAVHRVIGGADVILLVLDARLVEETRNEELEFQVRRSGKALIYAITKSDLVENKDEIEKWKKKLKPCVFISSKDYHGISILREKIMIEGKKVTLGNLPIKVGVLGYPNVGKSSLINAVSGKGSASTSSMSGHTKGLQKIRSRGGIMFLDTPGVIPSEEKDATKHAVIGSVDYTKADAPDLAAAKIMEMNPGKVEKYYGVEISEDFDEAIERIAAKKNFLKKGGKPDADRMAREILKLWQTGKIK